MSSLRKPWMTQPQIIRKGQMILVGLSELGDSRTDIPGLWARFGVLERRILNAVPTARYVVITWGGETELSYQHYIYVGIEVKRVQGPPMRSVIKVLPAVQYAVFSTWSQDLDSTWRYILQEWLPSGPYLQPGFIIQRYDRERYMQARVGKREIDILIPLRLPPPPPEPKEKEPPLPVAPKEPPKEIPAPPEELPAILKELGQARKLPEPEEPAELEERLVEEEPAPAAEELPQELPEELPEDPPEEA